MARNKQVKSKDGTTRYIEYVDVNSKHKICSLFPKDLSLETKVVPGCNDNTPAENLGEVGGVKYSFIEVGPKASRVFVGGGMNDTWEVRLDVPAYDHARDMIGYVFSDNTDEPQESKRSQELEGRGLFVPKGDVPTVAEIKAAQKKQREFYKQVAQRAQQYWAETRKMNEITELSIIAATALGHKYEWMSGEQRYEEKTQAEIMADAISLLIAQKQAEPAPVAASAQRK